MRPRIETSHNQALLLTVADLGWISALQPRGGVSPTRACSPTGHWRQSRWTDAGASRLCPAEQLLAVQCVVHPGPACLGGCLLSMAAALENLFKDLLAEEIVQGVVHLYLEKPIKSKAFFLEINGKEKTRWTT